LSEDKEVTDSLTHRKMDHSMTNTCSDEPKTLEDKEVDDFLGSENKKRVSNEIKQHNREKQLVVFLTKNKINQYTSCVYHQ
jgi:hypothetical protein